MATDAPSAVRASPPRIQLSPYPMLLAGLVLVITALDVLWRLEEKRSPHWDMARHLGDSLVYRRVFSLAHPLRFVETYVYYPPFVYWVTDAFYAVSGSEAMWVAVLSNVVFIAILVFATYGIGKTLWSPGVGVLSAFFVVTTPMMVTAFKEYMLDAPLTAMVALGLYFLIRSDGFSNLRYTLLFGATCGCGVLVKWTFAFALALPVAFTLVVAIAASIRGRRLNRLLNLAGAALLTFVLAAPWYVHNLTAIRHDASFYNGRAGAIRGSPPVASVDSVVWYFWDLVGRQLYLVPFLFFLVGVVFLFLNDDHADRNFLPVLTIVGTYVGLTFLRNKDARYTDPLLPAVSVIATSWLWFVSARARTWLAAAIVGYGTVAFLAISFGTSLLPENVTVRLGSSGLAGNIPSLNGDQRVTLFAQHGYGIEAPTKEDWHQADLFKAIAAAPQPERTFVFEGGDSEWFNTWGTNYYALRYHASWIADLNTAHFLIVRGSPTSAIPLGFSQIRSYTLPGGEALALYSRF
jgi:4-amino-4-deoxy-L-arabinose transferase-like glycosyltransferase